VVQSLWDSVARQTHLTNVIWATDFQFDTAADGRTMKMLNVIDEFTREALAIDVARSIDADGVVEVLDRLVLTHGAPHYVRFDNGPELVAHAVHDWCRTNSAGSLFIDPDSPWQNAWVESFDGRLRDEMLNSWRFDSLLEARVIIEDWRRDYNANRPHPAHRELTPTEFALQWTTTTTPSRIPTGPPNESPSDAPWSRSAHPLRVIAGCSGPGDDDGADYGPC